MKLRVVPGLPLVFLAFVLSVHAQIEDGPPVANAVSAGTNYVLGPKDTITLWARDVSDLPSQPVMIDSAGYINVPTLGKLKVAGLTTDQLQSAIVEILSETLVSPEVVVNLAAPRTLAVSVVGEVVKPGTLYIPDRQLLLSVLASAGGPRPEASPIVRVTRRADRGAIPHPGAQQDESGEFSTVEINVKSAETNPGENIEIKEDDVITVSKAAMVYITGDVAKPGGILADEGGNVSVMRAITEAGGLTETASPKNARILRTILDEQQAEIPLDIDKILNGKSPDVQLRSGDILFIPGSMTKSAALQVLNTAKSLGTSFLSFGLLRATR